MKPEDIKTFFKLGVMIGKLSEEELKTPQGQGMLNAYENLRKQYQEYMETVNDPQKAAEAEEKVSEIVILNASIQKLADLLNESSKTKDITEEGNALNVLIQFIQNHIDDPKKEDKEEK